MAATCLGAFGSYKLQYSRYLKEREDSDLRQKRPRSETVWVTQRYNPKDERVIAPVPRHKHVVPNRLAHLQSTENHWVPASDPPLASFNRMPERSLSFFYVSHPSSRSEEWSTLRQMLPSYHNVSRVEPSNWGTAGCTPPVQVGRLGSRFPQVTSCMTRYVDDMHKTHRQFKHC